MEEKRNVNKLMFIFAIPRLGSALLLGIVSFALLDLYYIGFGLNPFWVSVAIGLGYVSIALSQFFFGWISDYYKTRIGRRKPWIILLTPIEVIAFICLFIPQIFLHKSKYRHAFGMVIDMGCII